MDEQPRSRVGIIAAVPVVVVAAVFALWWFSPGQRLKRQVDSLIESAVSGDVKAVEVALAGGVDVNARDADGITPLMHVARGMAHRIKNPAQTDNPEIVQLLIKRGADVNAKTESGFVAIFWAARYGHTEIAKVLIENGADINAKDKEGISALHWATTNQQTKVIELLKAASSKWTPNKAVNPSGRLGGF